MKMPWALRVDLILAILRGDALQVSYSDGLYRFDIPSAHARRWRRRSSRIKKGKR